MSSGKDFEKDFLDSCERHLLDVTRLKDPVGGRSGVRNHCDFIVHQSPKLFHLELKSRRENLLSIADISQNQRQGLKKKADYEHTIPGVLIQFSDHNEVYFIHIREVDALQEQGAKSINVKYCRENCIKLDWERPRTRFKYEVSKLLRELAVRYGE